MPKIWYGPCLAGLSPIIVPQRRSRGHAARRRTARSSTIARSSNPQTFEKRRRERDKQQKQAMKAAARRERDEIKKAIKDGTIEAPGPVIIDLAELQPMAMDDDPS